MLARCSTMNRHHPEGLVHLIEALRNTSLQPAEPNATPQQQQQQPQQQQPQQNFVMDRAPGGAAAHVPSGAPVYDDPQGTEGGTQCPFQFIQSCEMVPHVYLICCSGEM